MSFQTSRVSLLPPRTRHKPDAKRQSRTYRVQSLLRNLCLVTAQKASIFQRQTVLRQRRRDADKRRHEELIKTSFVRQKCRRMSFWFIIVFCSFAPPNPVNLNLKPSVFWPPLYCFTAFRFGWLVAAKGHYVITKMTGRPFSRPMT